METPQEYRQSFKNLLFTTSKDMLNKLRISLLTINIL